MVVVVAPRLLLLSLLLYCLLGYVGGDAIDEVPSSSIRIRASSPISTVSEGVESETYCRYDALLWLVVSQYLECIREKGQI